MRRVPVTFLIIAVLAITANGQHKDKVKAAVFDARHEIKLKVPKGANQVRCWFTIPQDDPNQTVTNFKVESPVPFRIERDKTEGSKILYFGVEGPNVTALEVTVVTTFRLTRKKVRTDLEPLRSATLASIDKARMRRYLGANANVVIDDRVRKLASEIVGDEKRVVAAARKIYDYVLKYADYWVVDPANKKASPVGSTEYCLTTRTGNCTDFQSLWTSLARAAGIPSRIVYGSFFKKELDGKDIDQSYHCWTEFYVPRHGWIPQDVAVADLFAEELELNEQNRTLVQRTTPAGYFGKDMKQVDYYFANLDDRRVVWSIGRDLELSPKQDGGPVNAIPKAYVEIDGSPAKEGASADWVRKLTFKEVTASR
jgi:transglutaminase-like putative cysteine protease